VHGEEGGVRGGERGGRPEAGATGVWRGTGRRGLQWTRGIGRLGVDSPFGFPTPLII
jgi:hypothetical protein